MKGKVGLMTIFLLLLFNTSLIKAQRHDTTFIFRKVTKDQYHAVYIERDRRSKKYTRLLNFKMDKWDADGYQQSLLLLKKQKPFKTKLPTGLPKEWMPLYLYKGKYYIYYPSEWGEIGRRMITDSTLVYWSMDTPEPEPIQAAEKINEHTFYIRSKAFFIPHPPVSKLIIHIIDVKNGVAVWEDTSLSGNDRYGLYVSKQKARNFDMIVNYCREYKVDEFQFDKINHPALLKGH